MENGWQIAIGEVFVLVPEGDGCDRAVSGCARGSLHRDSDATKDGAGKVRAVAQSGFDESSAAMRAIRERQCRCHRECKASDSRKSQRPGSRHLGTVAGAGGFGGWCVAGIGAPGGECVNEQRAGEQPDWLAVARYSGALLQVRK